MTMDLSGFVQRKTKIEIGTKQFTFTELTLADLAEFRAELSKEREEHNIKRRKRIIEEAPKIGTIDPLELLKYVDAPITEEELEAEMETTQGIGLLAYLSLKYHHQGISREQVMSIITPNNLQEITKAMFITNGEVEDTKKKRPRKPLAK